MVATSNPTPQSAVDEPPRPRRWIPVSLRMLALLLAIVGVFAGREGVRMYRQQIAIREIEQAGGTIVETEDGGPDWLRYILGDRCMQVFDTVVTVNLDQSTITDAGLAKLEVLTGLRSLDLAHTEVTDAGLASVRPLRDLRGINLNETGVTDAALIQLKELPNLQFLYLSETRVTDAGLAHLTSLPNLERIDLYGTQVGDAGLLHLYGLTKLRRLEIHNTRVTYENAFKLKQTLPSLNIGLIL
jgi:Leucine Rich repeats (2 copies)/Leucine Rich repeat